MARIRSPEYGAAAAPSSTDMLIVIDPDGRFKGLGPRCPQAFGYSQAELLNQPFLAFVHADDRGATREALSKLAQGEPTLGFETRFRCKDNSYHWLAWTAMPTPEGVLYAVARDISERRPPEPDEPRMLGSGLDAARAQREGYLASVCHDVQQPLTVILAQTQLLQRQLARGEDAATRGTRDASGIHLLGGDAHAIHVPGAGRGVGQAGRPCAGTAPDADRPGRPGPTGSGRARADLRQAPVPLRSRSANARGRGRRNARASRPVQPVDQCHQVQPARRTGPGHRQT